MENLVSEKVSQYEKSGVGENFLSRKNSTKNLVSQKFPSWKNIIKNSVSKKIFKVGKVVSKYKNLMPEKIFRVKKEV